MKTRNLIAGIFMFLVLISCEKDEILSPANYNCNTASLNLKNEHPNADQYELILNTHRKNGLVGATLLVKDKNGLWIGASGKADIASNINVQPCNVFFIASISKVFTASAIYRYIEKGILTLEDSISKWLPSSIIQEVSNAPEAKIKHLLSHQSGILDYYTNEFELDRENRIDNKFTKEKVLEYIYGKDSSFSVGETYGYSNTNFLLLSMILEQASGLSLEKIYEQEIFNPLDLETAYYSEEKRIPNGAVKGYSEFTYNSGQFYHSENLYIDELGIGGDGGIAINAFNLSIFLERLMKGNIISEASLNKMTSWFDMPEDTHWETYGQTENGFGLEKFNFTNGYAVGHTGSISGFDSYGFYFPEEDVTYVLLVNGTKGGSDAHENIFNDVLEIMFE